MRLTPSCARLRFSAGASSTALPTDTWQTQFRCYDTLGGFHDVDVTFTNHQVPPIGTPPAGAVASWDWSAMEGGVPIGDSGTTGEPIYFDANGKVLNGAALQTITVPAANGAPVDITFISHSLRSLCANKKAQFAWQA